MARAILARISRELKAWSKRALADPSIPPPPFKPILQPSISSASLWKVVSDSQLGGKSSGSVEYSAPPAQLRFSGSISLELGGRLSSSGFCGFISHPHQFEHNLEDYDGVELLVKGDGRAYTFNIKTDSVIPDDMYQHPFRLPAGSWHTLRLSWPGFIRTRRGKELASQHQLDPSNIVSYGISVVDRGEGPFEVQLQQLQGYRQLTSRGITVAASDAASDIVQPVK